MDIRLVGIIILYTLSVIAAPSTEPSKVQKSDYAFKKITQGIPIRVLLQDGALNEVAWDIHSDEGFILYIPTTKEKSVIKGTKLMVTQSRGSLYLNGKKLADNQVYIMPIRGLIRLGTVAYDGIFSLTKTKEVAYLVNHLDLEEYLMSVLRYESMPGWPDEVQKAFCVAIRSYAIFKVMEQREQRAKLKQTYPYDIKNTNAHQVYRGHEKDTCYKKIVEATRDIVLAYKGKPILAMFDIACGGIVPGKKKGIHFDKAPYLKRMYACNYCNEHPCYRWETTLSFRELESGLKKLIPNLGSFRDMKIESHDDAGVVHHIRVRGSGGWFTITAAQLRSTFKSLRSLCFSFVKRVRSVTVRGKGHGHHMGLCQWGACSLVKKGWSYKKVLQYYYPDTTFMKLTRVT
jgi:stage II sporulation protein D